MIGIYCIKNIINNKIYIGSSINIENRFKQHLSDLRNNNHHNSHLQFSYNKHGENNFVFYVLKYFSDINRDELFCIEKEEIIKHGFNNTYNQTIETKCGCSELLKKECFVIDLNGNIVSKFNSIAEASVFLKLKYNPNSKSINNSSILRLKYRLVTKDFYENELELILSWRKYNTIKDSFVDYYKYDNNINRFVVFHNNEIVCEFKSEKDAIKISKYLLKLDTNK